MFFYVELGMFFKFQIFILTLFIAIPLFSEAKKPKKKKPKQTKGSAGPGSYGGGSGGKLMNRGSMPF